MNYLEHPTMVLAIRIMSRVITFLFIAALSAIATVFASPAQAAGKLKKETRQYPVIAFDPETYWTQCIKVRKVATCEKLLEYNKNIEDSKKQLPPPNN